MKKSVCVAGEKQKSERPSPTNAAFIVLRPLAFLFGIIIMASFVFACGVEKIPAADTPKVTPASAEGAKVGAAEKIKTKNGIEMVKIPAGEFIMGNDKGEEDERPAHRVKVSSFYMDVSEVTQESYEAYMGTNPAKHKSARNPVEQLGWFGAIKYCNMRSLKEGLKPCYNLETMACDFAADGYRLPTEAEWEYACRAQTTSDYSFGAADGLSDAGWFETNAGDSPHPVGGKKPNAWGLFDMHGNVCEWCNDVYSKSFYAASSKQDAVADPCNTAAGEERVLRGGAWNSDAGACRSSARMSEAPGLADVCFGYDAYGFRCVRRVSERGTAG